MGSFALISSRPFLKTTRMKMRILLLGSFIIGGSLVADANNGIGAESTKKSDIMGCVLHRETKKPLRNVSITAYNGSGKEQVIHTNGHGNYAFENLRPGVYRFVFQKDGYKKVVKDKVYIKTDNGLHLDVEMLETEDFNFMPGVFSFPKPL